MERRLKLGTRGSPLALVQARMVAAALEAAHGWADGTVEIVTLKTSGDRIQDRPLAEIGGKALWTKELDRALLAGETDLSVHSMKDVESVRPDGLGIAAMLERADTRDRLIGADSVAALPEGARIGTSSPRRAAQLGSLRPDLLAQTLRGNVATRLAKVEEKAVDATLLAAAGLERLGMDVGAPVPHDVMLPAPAQGAIGIDARSDDAELRDWLAAIDHRDTHNAVLAERAFVLALGGDCHSPVAALATVEGDEIVMRAELYAADGSEKVSDEARFARDDRETPAAMARTMLDRAPQSIRTLFST
ncbi:hydroxymethylbilane synthase [Sphingomicrobium nitratireducens]|uniref:hydroxymethylbilane synthase n=1 Tax=Sphingomicrobium nitratireducens TaxID=2964666 RepID=UPI00223F1232|nr:hydroxymethylbilane synthase [Sphingomicrobium nitratireducens]